MNNMESILNGSADMILPPLVQYCKHRIEAGERVAVEIERFRGEFGPYRSEIVIRRWYHDQPQEPQREDWDDHVNVGLIELGIRAIDLQEEGVRFSLGLRAAFRPIERNYGDGFLNSVLLDLLDESGLAREGPVGEVRAEIRTNALERGEAYDSCRDRTAQSISGRAAELRFKLGYDPAEVKSVMTAALATYLDERFSVSWRRGVRRP